MHRRSFMWNLMESYINGRQWRMIGSSYLYERGFAQIPDRTHFLYNCPKISKKNSKIDRKVYLKSVSVIFVLALFQDDRKSAISQPHLDFSMQTFPTPLPQKSFFQKINLISPPSPIHQDKDDRKWILWL